MPPEYVHFKPEEVIGLDPEFVAKLDMATAKTAELNPTGQRIPFVITSGLRSFSSNQSTIGAVADSSHLSGKAADLRVDNSHEVWLIVAALIDVGITRIGIYVDKSWLPIHIHCDVDHDKVQQVIFIKQEGQANSPVATA